MVLMLFSFIALSSDAALTANQLKYMGANFNWISGTTNIHGDVILADNQINYTMGYSTANGKWYNFVIGAASATINIACGSSTDALTVRTVPINVDGFNKVTITPYIVEAAASNFTGNVYSATLTCNLQPQISMLPYATIGKSSTYAKQLMVNAPLNVASAGTAQLGAGAIISTQAAYHYDLIGAKSMIVCVSGIAAGINLGATTCFMVGLSK